MVKKIVYLNWSKLWPPLSNKPTNDYKLFRGLNALLFSYFAFQAPQTWSICLSLRTNSSEYRTKGTRTNNEEQIEVEVNIYNLVKKTNGLPQMMITY